MGAVLEIAVKVRVRVYLNDVNEVAGPSERLYDRNGYCMIPAGDEWNFVVTEGALHRVSVLLGTRRPGIEWLHIT